MSFKILNNIIKLPRIHLMRSKNISVDFCTKNTSVYKLENIEELFLNSTVQRILKKITGMDYEKIFAARQRPGSLRNHKYEFVTEKRLKELQEKVAAKAAQKLQMPPVMSVRKPIQEVLSRDPELQGYLKHKYVFIDISPKESPRDRMITVREIDGTLRKADWEERERMNQIFYPLPGRHLETPKMYESPYFEKLLEDGAYTFILDSTCCQFEPDDPEYHRITTATYEHIKNKKKFDELRSTRHFGPMAFHFAVTKNIDSLLIDMIERNLINDAFDYIHLLYLIHKDMPEPESLEGSGQIEVIEDYIKKYASQKGDLELALQSFLEQNSKMNEEVST